MPKRQKTQIWETANPKDEIKGKRANAKNQIHYYF